MCPPRIRRAVLPWLAVLLFTSCARYARESPDTGLPGLRLAELRRQVQYLASDELGGREVDGAGIALAEERIAKSFAASGLKPLPGRQGFFQEFSLYRTGFAESSMALSLQTPAGEITAVPGKDFRPFEFSGSGQASAPVLFAGYGITAPEYGYDDYRGLDPRGAFVLVLRHEPANADPRSLFAGTANTAHAYFRAKAENARRRGAVGMLLVDDPLGSSREEELSLPVHYSLQPPGEQAASRPEAPPGDFLAVHLSRSLAEALLRSRANRGAPGLDLRGLQAAVDAGGRPESFPLEARVSLRVPPAETRRLQARNVVGFLEGSDPELRGEWLLIGAHHDHLGSDDRPGDAIFNGADDNASGVAGVLALARLFARNGSWREPEPESPGWRPQARRLPWQWPPRALPRRSLVFATFSAEEQGLFGSQALAGELAGGSAGRLVHMLNLDMIGRNPDQPVQILAGEPSAELRRIVERAAASAGLPAPRLSSGYGERASDHSSFYRQGVPYLFFFTGLHSDYHGVDDEAERLSYPRLAEVVRLAWRIASLLADAP